MADADLQQFLEKIRQLNAFVALTERHPQLREALRQCSHHDEVVALARSQGFAIGRRWGESNEPQRTPAVVSPGSMGSLLSGSPPSPGEEILEVLISTGNLRLERIHSCQASSPQGFWYEQEEHEWVCLLQGRASLAFDDEREPRILQTGDALLIRAGRRHRVVATDPDPGTIWLAMFWREDSAG
jgi:cupin 2 domain-containing protein